MYTVNDHKSSRNGLFGRAAAQNHMRPPSASTLLPNAYVQPGGAA